MQLFHVYRPRLPEVRAQTVQVLHTCHALAHRGHHVTLISDRGGVVEPVAALAAYGLDAPPTLDLRFAPTGWPPAAGWSFRAALRRWAGGARGPGRGSAVAYVRARRYVPWIPADVPVVWEAHEVDSELAREAGADPEPVRREEARLLARVAGVVTNCQGTLDLLREVHRVDVPCRVIHNATRADRVVERRPSPTPLVGYTGSARAYKGLATALASVARWPGGVELELVGGVPDAPLPPRVRAHGPVPYGELPGWLARYHALLLPLDDNVYGRSLVNPLKLWDYLATGIPVVAADLPGVREVAGESAFLYRVGDEESLADAVRRALAAGSAPVRLRTWEDRAAEVEAFLGELGLR